MLIVISKYDRVIDLSIILKINELMEQGIYSGTDDPPGINWRTQ